MTDNEKKNLIGIVFIKAKNNVKTNKITPNFLAKNIVNSKDFNGKLSAKSLRNYFNYYYKNGKYVNPLNVNLVSLINYYFNTNFTCLTKALAHFKDNMPSKDYIDKNVPCLNIEKSDVLETDKTEQKTDQNKQPQHILISIFQPNNKYTLYGFFALILLVFVFLQINYKTPNITINTTNNTNFKQITPTQDTQFFSKETGKPKVWYARYNNELEFFNAPGHHPKTNNFLKPVNKQIVKTYFIENTPVVKRIKGNKIEEKTRENNFFGIFNGDKIDNDLTNFFEKNYKKAEHTYKGTVTYRFRESSISKKLFFCELILNYKTVSKHTKRQLNSKTIRAKGSGFTKAEAKQNAILNIEL